MVPHASAQSWAVGSPSTGRRRTARPRPGGGRSPPRSTTNWSMQTRPRIGRRLPPTRPRRRCRRGAGRRRRSPTGTRPTWSSCVGGPGVAVGDRRRPAAICLTRASRARTVIAGTRPRSGGVAGRRVEAVDRDAAADQVEAGARAQERGRRVGEVPHLGPQPGSLGERERLAEGRLLRVVGGVVGLVAAGEVGPDAGDRPAARAPRRRGPPRPAPAQSSAVAPPRESPVSTLSCTRAGGRPARRGRGDLVELGHGVGGQVDVGGDRRRRSPRRGRRASTASGRCRRRRAAPAPRRGWRRRASRRRPRARPGADRACRGRSRRP